MDEDGENAGWFHVTETFMDNNGSSFGPQRGSTLDDLREA
jgi:hypothetical protein